jgi:hypothetical protein
MDTKNQSFSDAESKFKALIGVDVLNTFDQTLFRHALKQYFRKAYESYPWPEFCHFGEEVTLNVTKQIRIFNKDNDPFTSSTEVGMGDNNIDSVLNIFKLDPKTNIDGKEYIFFETISNISSRVVQILTNQDLNGQVVYVSYKNDIEDSIKELINPNGTTGFFGSGSGDTNVIPFNLFEYMVQGSYVQYLKSDGQNQKAILEEQFADKILLEAINKIQNTGKQYRHNLFTERPRSQFNRHNYSQASQVILPGQGGQQG